MCLLRLIPAWSTYYNEYLYLDPLMYTATSECIHALIDIDSKYLFTLQKVQDLNSHKQNFFLGSSTLFSFYIISLFKANMFLFYCQFRREVRNVFLKIAALITLQSICYKYLRLYILAKWKLSSQKYKYRDERLCCQLPNTTTHLTTKPLSQKVGIKWRIIPGTDH